MYVKDIMTKDISFVSPEENISTAARRMKDVDCGILPVSEDAALCVGIITDRDIVIRTIANGDDPKETKIRDCMTLQVFFCQEEHSLIKAADLMREYQVSRLLVKNSDGNITGIITFGAMLWKTTNASEAGHIIDRAAPRKLRAQ